MPSIPKRKSGESWTAYHDRLAEAIYEAEQAGDEDRSLRLQRAAGKVALEHPAVTETDRSDGQRGPGTYPWYECVSDQLESGYTPQQADAICGRIRGDSRKRYPEYWALREGYSSAKARKEGEQPRKGGKPRPKPQRRAAERPRSAVSRAPMMPTAANPASRAPSTQPYIGIELDGGPSLRRETRDYVLVVGIDRTMDPVGTYIIDLVPVPDPRDIRQADSPWRLTFEAQYPDLPIIGPFHVLARDIRDIEVKLGRHVRATPGGRY